MKKNVFFLSLIIVLLISGCKASECIKKGEPPYESISGYVYDEAGNALKGIKIEVFLDENLENYYNSPECKQLECCCVYTDERGLYGEGMASEYYQGGPEYKNVYVVATDTSGIYERQVIPSRIDYDYCGVGMGHLNITMKPQPKE